MRIKLPVCFSLVSLIAVMASCDFRSGTAKEEMEKWESKPASSVALSPTPTPIDASEIVTIDTNVQGDMLSANGHTQKSSTACTKFNRLLINGDDGVINVTGACRQIMVNGDRNKITVDAAMEFVLNGSENNVKYSRFVNGKAPSVVENKAGNVIEKVGAATMTTGQPRRKIVK